MNEFNTSDAPIRITREEALSEKVDDFLSRQKSMIGESGIGKEKSAGKWYLQNWFLFGLAGGLAAFLMWAISEPYFDDLFYTQGVIEAIDLTEPGPGAGVPRIDDDEPMLGWLDMQGQKIWLWDGVLEYRDGDTYMLDGASLQVGREVGAYVNYYPVASKEGFALARYVVLSPEMPAAGKTKRALWQQEKTQRLWSLLLFALIAGAVGFAIGAVEGLVCRVPKRALTSGLVGLLVGLVGGFLINLPGEAIYGVMSSFAMNQTAGSEISPFALFLQTIGRGLAWALIGMAMGLGQGIALRSKRLLLYGFLGGVIGSLLGGLLFDPIYFFIEGKGSPSAHWSRLVGFTLIGLSVGAMIGIVQLLARDFWLRMTQGPLAGKEFLFFKDTMAIGASPKCEIYLFNDPNVLDRHATVRTAGDGCEIESLSKEKPVFLNERSIQRSKLRHGDRITIGRTSFIFQMKQG